MTITPPRLINNYIKSSLVPFRFEKDAGATPEAFKNRGRFFDMLEVARLQQLESPSLVSSVRGTINRILFTIPGWVLLPAANPGDAPIIAKYAAVFRHMLSALPPACQIVLLTNKRAQQKAKDWLQQLGITERTTLALAADSMRFTVWAEDAYCVCSDTADDELYFVEPASFNRADDAYIADRVAPQASMQSTQVQLYFQGGNVLIGDDFWFIGADYPAHSLALEFVVPKPGESTAAAVARVYGGFLDKQRKFYAIGSRVPVPSHLERPINLDGETWTEVLYFGNAVGTVQPLFHIDMFISFVGRDANGKFTVLVGSPQLAADILGEPLPEGAMQEVFDDIAEGLGALGFNVVRNPLPLAYGDDDSERKRYWYFCTGNNVLVQDQPKKVWLPTYGHDHWAKLAATDAANKAVWEGLGYTVELLPDFHPFASNLGAAHCIKKYLARAT